MRARAYRSKRCDNQHLSHKQPTLDDARRQADMSAKTESFFKTMIDVYAMSARSMVKTLLIARTIADMEQAFQVEERHIASACALRFQSGFERSAS